ncbi:MAG TPA: molybdopterin molybdotransferase MoeA [Aeromicrobium sp.]|mgnify:CR=1 FL=1|nr:molybdopterin molybdotransferase MoeA [Aeromicrobium sp.]
MGRSVDAHVHQIADAVRLAIAERAKDGSISLAVGEIDGGRLASAAYANRDVPGFDNSQMDGFAVNSADLATTANGPVTLTTVAHVVAGATNPPRLESGQAAPIMTGAPLPPNADAVVAVERTLDRDFGPPTGGGTVTFHAPVTPGAFIRTAGVDVRAGALLLDAGAPLHPGAVGALVAAGVQSVNVAPRLRLAIVSTGSEVANGDVPDVNATALRAAATQLGLAATTHVCPDDPEALSELLEQIGLSNDLIITTGGVSAGTREVVRQALAGAPEAWFGHVDVQPGGPQGLAQIDVLGRVIPVVCLPGNPVSALVSFELFLRPPLAESVGLAPWRQSGQAPLAEPLESVAGRLQVRRGRLDDAGQVNLIGGPGSHLMASYARADLLVLVPEQVTSLSAGDTVEWWRIA